ncbi:MAG TPA: glycosyltransferase family 87 protein [Candidatus Binatia bacterium]|nr:glycosyltransferase family 87 protein [Candidatus Binatia bacterium]
MPLRRAFEICALLIAAAILATLLMLLSRADGLVIGGQPVFGDFIGFWSAGRAALDGHAADVHDRALIFSYHQLAAPGVEFMAWWNAPPTFLLVMTPLALLPFPVAAMVFLVASAAVYFIAARKLLPGARALIFAATLPAAVFQLGTVQTGLLIAGVSGLALYWLDRRPLAAGALVGALAIKPHLALLWPVFLALSGRWRAFAAAAIGTVAFIGLAALVFGPEPFVRFFENLRVSQSVVSEQLITTPAYASLYGNLLGAGLPNAVALAAQIFSAATALAIAAWIFLKPTEASGSGAALCAATLLISPYLFFYDFTLLAAGAALLGAPRDRFELAAIVAAWSAGLSLTIAYLLPVPLCPLAAWLILLAAARRVRARAYPTQRTPDQPRSAQS